jgi:4-diphosphocytidyl-2-C-methyl-D-erythritol kinase
MTADAQVDILSFAKVNFTLDVVGLMPDGFHAIESVMQTVSLYDRLHLRFTREPGISVTCTVPEVPLDERNLAYKAALLFYEEFGFDEGLDIRIEKHIPLQAGLGGGSSNAAAVLKALSLRFTGMSENSEHFLKERLSKLAEKVGSDVPFFLTGGTAFVAGKGQIVQSLPDIPTQWLVIVKPPFGVSTAWAYRRLDEMRGFGSGTQPMTTSRRLSEYLQRVALSYPGADLKLESFLHNDLEAPVIERYHQIKTLKEALLDFGAKGALMCGSGSAVFGLFTSETEARKAYESLNARLGERFVVRTLNREEMKRFKGQ